MTACTDVLWSGHRSVQTVATPTASEPWSSTAVNVATRFLERVFPLVRIMDNGVALLRSAYVSCKPSYNTIKQPVLLTADKSFYLFLNKVSHNQSIKVSIYTLSYNYYPVRRWLRQPWPAAERQSDAGNERDVLRRGSPVRMWRALATRRSLQETLPG